MVMIYVPKVGVLSRGDIEHPVTTSGANGTY